MVNQRYGWVLQKKRIKWSQLQSRMRHETSVQLEEELRRDELQHGIYARGKGYLGEPEQSFNVRDDDEDIKLMNGIIGS